MGEELEADALDEIALLGLELGHDLASEVADLLVGLGIPVTARPGELLADLAQVPIVRDDRADLGLLAPKRAAALGVGRDLRPRPLGLDLGETTLQLVETSFEGHATSAVAPPVGDATVASSASGSSAASTSAVRDPTSSASVRASGMGSRSGSQLPSGALSPFAARAS